MHMAWLEREYAVILTANLALIHVAISVVGSRILKSIARRKGRCSAIGVGTECYEVRDRVL